MVNTSTDKTKRGRGRPPKPIEETRSRKGKTVNVWINAGLRDRLDNFVATFTPRTSLTAVVEAALTAWLDKNESPPK